MHNEEMIAQEAPESPDSQETQQAKQRFWLETISATPPRVRFAQDIRTGLPDRQRGLDFVEFMMVSLEQHPIIPFEKFSFGSNLLNFRRAVAYEVVLRLLAHVRSFVVNINIRNRLGAGSALRCMLDIYALLTYLSTDGRLGDQLLLEKFLVGQSFATGTDYWLKKEWQAGEQPIDWVDTKKILENWLGLPKTHLITGAAHSLDEGFSALYARYSEYVHFVFSQPRMEIEEAFGHSEESPFGSEEYFRSGQLDGAPLTVLGSDLATCSFVLQMTWPLLFASDPFLENSTKPGVHDVLRQQGLS